jgi:hypothetical protein
MRPIEGLKNISLIHGEEDKMDIFAEAIKRDLGHEANIMAHGVSIKL